MRYIYLALLIYTSCGMLTTDRQQEILPNMPGKVAVFSDNDDTCTVYIDCSDKKIQFPLKIDKQTDYSDLSWSYKTDSFFAIQYFNSPNGIIKTKVVLLDFSGRMAQELYEAPADIIAGSAYPSREDKLLLIETSSLKEAIGKPFWGLTRLESISIMDVNSRRIIKTIPNMGRLPNFYLEESPWLFEGNAFVYTITADREIALADSILNPENESPGIYEYDLSTDKKTLLIPYGSQAICSPTTNKIAYVIEHSLFVLDINTKKSIKLFQGNSNTTYQNIHWTPDGKAVYTYYAIESIVGDISVKEKIIDITTKKEIPFRGGIIGIKGYTWK